MAKRYELSDEAWAVVADLFTETHGRGRPRLSDRLMLDGVLWVLCSGAAWRDMPERFGPWSTVYQRFRVWRNQGTFDQMLIRLHLRLNEPRTSSSLVRRAFSTPRLPSLPNSRSRPGPGPTDDWPRMISRTRAELRRAVQRLISSSITSLIIVCSVKVTPK
jgi:transposase